MRLSRLALLAVTTLTGLARAQPPAPVPVDDPYLWREDVNSPRAMAWVAARDAYSTGKLEADPRYAANYADALAIAGPQHARKFAARMEQMGLHFYYYENTEGGHGSGADLKQTTHASALTGTYLKKLME